MQLDVWTKGGQLFGGQLKDYLLKSDGDLQGISLEDAHKYILPTEKRKNNDFYDLAKDGERVSIKGDDLLILSHDISNINVRRPKLRSSKEDNSLNPININITLKNEQEIIEQIREQTKKILTEAQSKDETPT